ncbi:MAG: NADH-quinone oxidoreductase subunit C/D [Bryobacterales bacterium]|nr:NADH-quinone oxidoreductase subunit C/D [Bryobacterales bacterium]MBV9401210.1 NADH-quinone oxidoreductase subunit C/D [Bryobacterales bacterium]
MIAALSVTDEIQDRFGNIVSAQTTRDHIPTLWTSRDRIPELLRFLKEDIGQPYRMLYDLTAIDERMRTHRDGQPASDYTVVYQLFSFDRNSYIRIKTGLTEDRLSLPTVTRIWPNANWYEREVWDMFGIVFDGHPHLERILMPKTWNGHPLRKDHPARATEMGPYELPEWKESAEQEALRFRPEEWGLTRTRDEEDFMFLNVGPQHPGTHGVIRIVLQLNGEEILDAVPEIGFHHRGAEKMGERQTWHTYIPYTDRVDYLAGVTNNLAYLTAVETLAGIHVPPRGQTIRVMLTELFRIINHLVWYGTFAQDLGQLSPVFYTFNDRERAFAIIEAVCGARMHPNWFRIGGVSDDLPKGWDRLIRDFLNYLPKRLDEYDTEVMQNSIFQGRTKGIGGLTVEEAIDWGVTGPNLRACGLAWDFRKKQPYSGYEQFDFDIPMGRTGDCYDRAVVRVEEMRQSLRIIEQCMNNMPGGPHKAEHHLTTPPLKPRTMHDIETLITHFLGVSWGPVLPPGEALGAIEATKGNNGYYLVSDGATYSYRTRIRTPSFPHMQTLPFLCRGLMVPDLLAILGSLDFVLADIDR